jgi:TatA/E family protein of Tat protein translocase
MFGIGGQELILILVVALLVFGPKRLPELARSLGRGLAEFRRASSDLRQTLQEAADAPSSLADASPGGTEPKPERLEGAAARDESRPAQALPDDEPPEPREEPAGKRSSDSGGE